MSAVGSDAVLGEIAHIVARSADGPRGDSELRAEERDAYTNLILLCPTHHREIDAKPEEWTSDSLSNRKAEHERWAEEMLERGTLLPTLVDSKDFRDERIAQWALDAAHSWAVAFLTPLEIVEETVDPLVTGAREILISSELPSPLRQAMGVVGFNSYYLEPSAAGMVVENSSEIGKGLGYRFELYRCGHVEYAIALDFLLFPFDAGELGPRVLADMGDLGNRRAKCTRRLPYRSWAPIVFSQISLLLQLWEGADLPFRNMVLTYALTSVQGVCVFAENDRQAIVGRPVEGKQLSFSVIVEKGQGAEGIAEVMLGRLVNFFGLVPPSLRSTHGGFRSPITLTEAKGVENEPPQ